MNGIAFQIRAGAWKSARNGEVPMTAPVTIAASAIQKIHLSARASRKRVQSLNRLCVLRSKPPKNLLVQNRWYADQCSLIRKWIWRSTSTPASARIHQRSRTWK